MCSTGVGGAKAQPREPDTDSGTRLQAAEEAGLSKTAKENALRVASLLQEEFDEADKSAALASYAKQADDDELYNFAVRVRARAIRRCGELLKQIEKSTGGRPTEETCFSEKQVIPPQSRSAAAREAGLSKTAKENALRVATIPEEDFDEAVESNAPPTITQLAERGLSLHPFVACNFGVSQNAT